MSEQIMFDFVANVQQLKPAAEALRALNQITDEQYKAFQKVATASEQYNKSLGGSKQATDQAKNSAVALGQALKQVAPSAVFGAAKVEAEKFNNVLKETGSKSISLKGQLRALKEELAAMETAGKENTAEFERLQIKAGKLNDQLGDTQNRIKVLADDSKYIKVFSEAIGGVASAYSVAQGAAGLFGDKNKDIEEALLKVNSAMALANGLQQINVILQKQSYLNVLGNSAALTTETGAITLRTVATGAATVAQNIWNAAINSFPAIAVVTAIMTVIQVISKFTGATEKAKLAQTKLNDELETFIKLKEQELTLSKTLSNDEIDSLQTNIELMKSRGESLEKIYASEKQLIELKRNAADKEAETQDKVLKQSELATQRFLKNNQFKLDSEEAFYDAINLLTQSGSSEAEKSLATSLQKQLDDRKALEQSYSDLQKESLLLDANHNKEKVGNNKKATTEIVKEIEDRNKLLLQKYEADVAYSEASAALSKKDSEEELARRIDVENEKAILARKQVELSDDTAELKKAKIIKINADEIAAIEKLNQDYATKQIQLDTNLATERKKLADDFIKTSQEEYSATLQQAEENYLDEKLLLDKRYISGELNEKQYNAALINLDKNKNVIMKGIAHDYSATVKQAKTDEVKYASDAAKDEVDIEKKKKLEKEELLNDLKKQAIATTREVINMEYDLRAAKRNAELDATISAFEKKKDAELKNKNLTEAQKAAIEEKYRKKEAEAKRKAYEEDKKAKKAQAVINGALAITNVIATTPYPASLVAAASTAILTAEQVRVIQQTPIPQFAKGTKKAPSGFKLVGEEGPELIYDKGGYPIIPHRESMQILKNYGIQSHTMSNAMLEKGGVFNHSTMTIDYNKLGEVITDKLSKHQKVMVSIDKHGIKTMLQSGNDVREYLNDRYSTSI